MIKGMWSVRDDFYFFKQCEIGDIMLLNSSVTKYKISVANSKVRLALSFGASHVYGHCALQFQEDIDYKDVLFHIVKNEEMKIQS